MLPCRSMISTAWISTSRSAQVGIRSCVLWFPLYDSVLRSRRWPSSQCGDGIGGGSGIGSWQLCSAPVPSALWIQSDPMTVLRVTRIDKA